MRAIVFSTIAENIKSFFQREEQLEHKPRQIPEAASEIYSKPQQKIVEKPLPQKLPFSPDDLRQALKVPEARQEPPRVQPADITHEIVAFERTLQEAHETVKPEPPRPQAVIQQKQAQLLPEVQAPAVSPEEAPFFNEFEQFITREDLETDGILEKDILYRMKEFHKHRLEGKEYYLYSKDVQDAVNRKLAELKGLEREWFDRREQADELEKSITLIEHEIETRTAELKGLIRQSRQKSCLEQQVPQGQEFVLADGRKLASLLDLKIALKSMPETVFSHHVTSVKNDFAAWVRGALANPQLADEMGSLRERQQIEMLLSKI